ncbi:MAG: peptidase M14, partial [Acidobacteria bacterium ACB2]|nr:peptidase M14 [Acidobacteria bacterium ACB2]
MRRSPAVLTGLLALAVLLLPASPARAIEVPSPSGFLGMAVGADRTLADWEQVSAYFRALDAASPRVEVVSLGKTTLGAELLMAVVSSEENLARKDRIREVARRLADPRGLTAAEEAALVEEGRAVVLVTCAIHSSEVAATQMAMEWAHALATGEDEETRRRLSEVVLLLVPSLNPDGHRMEVEWYRKNLGTPYEGSRMPWLYHPYVGHDDNRDWTMLTQVETKAMTRAVYKEWHPQVWLDEHQMGSSGPRMFVPPYAEPVDPDIHPLVWREVNLIGSRMALALEQAGKSGVIYGYSFDAYWIGGTKNTAWWKNVTGLLTEVASARMATPVFVPETELSGGRKGLVDYGPQTNFPNPWPGGWWRLRDVMDYERIASDALLATCADHRRDLLFDTAARARQTVAAAAPGEAIRIPAAQRDRPTALLLARLLDEHGVEVRQGPGGDLFVPLGQPYGRFVREVLGTQRYPEVRLVPGKEPVLPYDVAAWSLPLLLGVAVEPGKMPDGLLRFEPAPAKAAPL